MKRFLQWFLHRLESPGVNLLAVIALAGVIGTTVIGSIEPNPLGFDIEPDSRPVYYDLCLAYLAGWIFHLLVVVIPEHRKREALMGALKSPLMIIANSGETLIEHLERIAACPKVRPVTEDHLKKVMTALNSNGAVQDFIALRLSYAQKAYSQLIPYMSALPLQLQIALHRENENAVHRIYGDRYLKSSLSPLLHDLRKEDVMLSDEGTGERITLVGARRFIWRYLEVTKAVYEELRRHEYLAELDDSDGLSFRGFTHGWSDAWQEEYTEYPPTATSKKPLDSFS